jgi:hypothetical protein
MARGSANPPRPPPIPTPIYRIVHIDNLPTLLARDALHAPNHVPPDGLTWVGIHATQTQTDRGQNAVPVGPGGIILDYVGFYFGSPSPMLYRIHTGWNVRQVDQCNVAYLVSTAQAVADAGRPFVFSDGHGLAAFTSWFDDLRKLDRLDWPTIYAEWWRDTPDDMDRQRRKQAEFLVHRSMPWRLIERIGVCDAAAQRRVQTALAAYSARRQPSIVIERSWYY